MTLLRNKMEDSTIASQLDVVIAQKHALGAIKRCQVDDLNEILDEVQSIVGDTRALITLVTETLGGVVPLVAGNSDSDSGWGGGGGGVLDDNFSKLENLQNVWEDASDGIEKSELRMKALKEKYDNNRLNKLILLGEPIPPSLQEGGVKDSSEITMSAPFSSKEVHSSSSQIVKSSKNIDLSTKDEKELVGVLALSVGKAAFASAKAGLFGLKALLETMSDEEVSGITEDALKKSAGISKVSSGLAESVESIRFMKYDDDLKKVAINNDLKSGIESTGETLKGFGKAGKTIVNKVSSASSASQASNALKETSEDLIQAFNAVTALSMKSIEKNRKNKDEN